jgi:tellurite resistance-related uncharacterized protein
MKTIPAGFEPYNRTPDFSATSIPSGLLNEHRTSDGVWGKIVVLEGLLTYRVLEPKVEEYKLTPEICGVIEPAIGHQVVPETGVRFYVEFYRLVAA